MPLKISARVNTYNEQDNIGPALESLSFADELLVVDSFSTDRTVEIARRYTSQVIQRPFASHGDQHNYADSICSHEWVFVLDADERVTPELRAEIMAIKQAGTELDGFRMPRLTWYMDRWIRHSGWYPNYQPRLYRRDRGHWAGEPPHEAPKIQGRVGTLQGQLLHYTRRNLKEHLEVMNRYTTLSAQARYRQGLRPSWNRLYLAPPFTFLRNYVVKQGFRDGIPGVIVCALSAFYVHVKEAKLFEMHMAREPENTGVNNLD